MKKLIVGLGNPEPEYEKTRHNVGQMFVDWLAAKWGLDWKKRKDLYSSVCQKDEIILAKPLVFMNESGRAVRKLKDKLEIKNEDIYVVHDELDLPLGRYLISLAKSSPLHKGVISVVKEIKMEEFWRVRIGIDGRSEENRIPGEKYVLGEFNSKEEKLLKSLFVKTLEDLSID